ncbi:hypothetical protein ABIC64_000230 [Plantibacter flavus]
MLTVLPLDGSAERPGTTKSIAFRRDAHRAELIVPDPDTFEDAQARLEMRAAPIVRRLVSQGHAEVPEAEREILERLIVLHLQRHPVMMEFASSTVAAEQANLREHPLFERAHADYLSHAVSFAALLDDADFAYGGDEAKRWTRYRRELGQYRWSVVSFDRPSLVISDVWVCASRLTTQRGVPARAYGFVGIAEAERITVPLSPTAGLLLSRPGRTRLRAESFNRTSIRSATDFIAHPPSWPNSAPDLHAHARMTIRDRLKPQSRESDRLL